MIFTLKNLKIEISFYFLIVIALIIINDQTNLSLYFAMSILVHELGHLLAIIYHKIKINKICFKIYGIKIEISNNCKSSYIDIFILLSGSLANFLFSLIMYSSNKNIVLTTINIIIGVFNLLPVESLDGGKILNILLTSHFSMKTADCVSTIVSVIFIAIFSAINFLFMIHGNFNITLTVLCAISIFKIMKDF